MPRILKRVVRLAAALVALALFAGLAVIGLFVWGNSSPPALQDPFPSVAGVSLERPESADSGAAVRFEVRRGESSVSVGNRLADAGLIRSRDFWNLAGRMRDMHVKAGVYIIDFPSNQMAIRRILESGREQLIRVTVKEGLTLRETAGVLEQAGITGTEDFIAAASDRELLDRYRIPGETMEGYLFPDTYMFPAGLSARRTVAAMADNFFARLAAIDENAASMSPEALDSVVRLASIVEREYRVPEEAALMAGVFENRLKRGMRLESCATVVYVITEQLGKPHPNRIFFSDLEIKSPFNTYLVSGLPPAPISSPGLVALRAALNPQPSDYLFFRLIDEASGRHHFSKTMDEHISAAPLIVKSR